MISQIKNNPCEESECEAGLKEVTDMFITIFEGMKTTHTCKNAQRISATLQNVLANLLGKKLPNPASINEEVIDCA